MINDIRLFDQLLFPRSKLNKKKKHLKSNVIKVGVAKIPAKISASLFIFLVDILLHLIECPKLQY